MKEKASFSFHSICLIAVFTVGNAVINAPYANADDETFLGFLISAVCSFLLLLIICPLTDWIFNLSESQKTKKGIKWAVKAFYLLICAAILINAGTAFGDFTDFVSKEVLPDTAQIIIALVFALTVLWISLQKDGVILKLSVFAFLTVAIVSVFFFVLSAPRFKFQNIILLQFPDLKEIYSQTVPYIVNILLCCIPALIYQKNVFGRIKKRLAVTGVLSGFAVIGLCLLNSLLLFGVKAAVKTDFPYAASISTVTIGNLFTRMDGFSYFLFFTSCLIKIAVSIMLAKNLLKGIGVKKEKITVSVLTALVFLISYI